MAEFQKKENFAIIKIENAEYKVESIAGNRMICAYNDNTPSFLKQIEESKYVFIFDAYNQDRTSRKCDWLKYFINNFEFSAMSKFLFLV